MRTEGAESSLGVLRLMSATRAPQRGGRQAVRRSEGCRKVRVARETQVLRQTAEVILATQHSLGGDGEANAHQRTMDGRTAHRSKPTREMIRRAANFTTERCERPAPAWVCSKLEFDFFGPPQRACLRSGATCLTPARADFAPSSECPAQQRERSLLDLEWRGAARLQRWHAPRGEKVGRWRRHGRAYRIERRAVVDASAICAFKRLLQHVGRETQAGAVVSISNRMAYAILASRREEEHRRRVAYESAASNMFDEHTAMRHDDMMIRGRFRSAASRLVRAAPNARDLDQLGGKEPLVVQRNGRLDVLLEQSGAHGCRLDRHGYGVNPERHRAAALCARL